MKCIAAVDSKWGIGKDNCLLFHIPADMEFFKQKTIGKIVVMGKNTLLSLPDKKPLANRTNIVLSTSLKRNDCIVCNSLDNLLNRLSRYSTDDIFVIGGAEIYRQLLPYCNTAYITKVKSDKAATKFFPNLDTCSDWKLICKSPVQLYGKTEFCFCEYVNSSSTIRPSL